MPDSSRPACSMRRPLDGHRLCGRFARDPRCRFGTQHPSRTCRLVLPLSPSASHWWLSTTGPRLRAEARPWREYPAAGVSDVPLPARAPLHRCDRPHRRSARLRFRNCSPVRPVRRPVDCRCDGGRSGLRLGVEPGRLDARQGVPALPGVHTPSSWSPTGVSLPQSESSLLN